MNSRLRNSVVTRYSNRAFFLLLACLCIFTSDAQAQFTATNVVSGLIAVPGQQDSYTFAVSTNSRFYFDSLTNAPNLTWSLNGPEGAVVTARNFSSSDAQSISDPTVSLPVGGYTITIQSGGSTTGGYSFRFVNFVDATLLSPGTVVSNSTAIANRTDLYQFPVTAGDRYYFHQISRTGLPNTYWRLMDPYGNQVFSQGFTDAGTASAPIALTAAGTYTLMVEGYIGDTGVGTYAFSVIPEGNVPPAAFTGTPINLGDLITGTLAANTTDSYVFTLANSTSIIFDPLTNSANLNVSLIGPSGVVVNQRQITTTGGIYSFGPFVLPAGSYQLNVEGNITNSYQFRVLDLANATALTPGIVVTNTLNPASSAEVYRFDVSAGARFFFDSVGVNNLPDTYWRLVDPNNVVLFNVNAASSQGPINLNVPGTYHLLVEGYLYDPGAGSNIFKVVPVTDGLQALTLGNVVNGAIASPGQKQQYTFSLGAAARLYFDSLTNTSVVRWSLDGPDGNFVNSRTFNGSDAQNIGNPLISLAAGSYTLTVTASGDAVSGYSFRLFDIATATPLVLGVPLNATLNPANSTVAYQFTLATPTKVFYDPLSSSGLPDTYLRLFDSNGDEPIATGLASIVGPLVLPAGSYTLLVEGYIGDTGSGSYAFNLIPVNDGLQSLTLGNVVNGAISSPGQRQQYTFSVASAARLYFDSLTNSSVFRWYLDGPTGNLVYNRSFNGSDAQNIGNPLLSLVPGNYTLTVVANSDSVGAYQFRLFDLATASPMVLGTPVNGTLNPANSTVAYQFSLASPTKVLYDALSSSGLPNTYLRLVDANGNIPIVTSLSTVTGPLVLPAGSYTLLVEGYIGDSGAGSYSFNLTPVTDGSQALTLGSVVTGAVAAPGQSQRYTFSLGSAARLYFDSLTNTSVVHWSLDGPTGNIVNSRNFNSSDAQNIGNPLLSLAAGNYTLTVAANSDSTGGYQFRLFDIATAAPLTLGTVVNGTLNPANSTMAYQFSLATPTKVLYDYQSSSGLPNTYVRLFDSYGNVPITTGLNNVVGPQILPAGTYTLLVEGYIGDSGSGTFALNLTPVTDGLQTLTLGSVVNGAIASPGQRQQYTFSLGTASRLYFDSLTNASGVYWSLDGPTGNIVNARSFSSSDAQSVGNPVLSVPAGNYTLTLFTSSDVLGGYEFRLLNLAAATVLTPGTPVTVNNFVANSTALYQFTAAAGDQIDVLYQVLSGMPDAYSRLIDPYGNIVYARYPSSANPGTNGLIAAGTYTLLIEGYIGDTGTGSYTVNVQPEGNVPISPFSGEPLTVGTPVSGILASNNATTNYIFTLASPARLYFDALTNVYDNWYLYGPQGLIINNRSFLSSDGPDIADPALALPAGSYQIVVTGQAGNYQFDLIDFAVATPYTPGTAITNTLAPANSTVFYQFNGTAGQQFYFNGLAEIGFSYVPYCRIYAPDGNIVMSQNVNGTMDTFALTQTGTYTLTVEGRVYDAHASGAYAFDLIPVSYPTNSLTLGQTITNTIATPGIRQYYTFTLASAATLYFDALTNADFYWRLDAPWGQVVNWRSFLSSDSIDVGDPSLHLPAGTYTLAVAGDNFTVTGAYQFTLLNFSNATAYTLGTAITNTLAPANSTVFYQFTGAAGQQIYFNGLGASGFSYTPYVRLFAPLGNIVMSQGVGSDVDTFTLTESGTYTIAVEGRVYDTHASGSYAFNFLPVSYPTNGMVLGQTIASTIATRGVRQYYTFTLPTAATLYFDALTNADFYWRLDAPWGQVVNWRSFTTSDSVDASDPSLQLPAGNYTLGVAGDNFTVTGGYQFRLLNFTNATTYTPGTAVTNTLAPANGTVFYQFTGRAGDLYYFHGLASSGFTYQPYTRLYAPDGNIVMSQYVNGNVDTFALPQSGTYTLTVEGRVYDNNTSGTYAFNLIPTVYPTNSLIIGQTINNTITAPGQRQYYTFTLASAATLYFDALTNSNFSWRLDALWGQVVGWTSFSYSDSADINDPALHLAAGTYTLGVAGNGFTVLGGYQFRLLNFTNATAYTPGTAVTNTLVPADSTVFYQFTGTAGGQYYFDGLASSGFAYQPYSRLYGPDGHIIMSQYVNNDAGPFALPVSGAYTLTVEGRIYDNNAIGTYAFNLVPDPQNAPQPLFPTNVSPDLVVSQVAVSPSTGLQSSGAATIQWTDQNIGSGATGGSFTDRITIRNAANQVLVDTFLPYNVSDSGNGPIAPQGTRNRQITVTLPDGTNSVGVLQVTVTVDAQNAIAESNEANNSTTFGFSVTLAPYPDLQVTNVVTAPTNRWLPGSVVAIDWQLTNSGTASAATNWTDSVVVRHKDSGVVIFSATTNYNLADAGNGPIAPADFRNRSISFTMPGDATAYGAFSVTITADSANQLFEYNTNGTAEENNSATINLISAPDLIPTGLAVSAAGPLQSGAAVSINWNDQNAGTVDTGSPFYDRVTVVNTNTGETLFSSTVYYDPNLSGNGAIPPGGSRARSATFQLPDGLRGVGTLLVSVALDTANQLPEFNASGTGEANNTASITAVSVIANYPDLQVVNLGVQPIILNSGTNLTVLWQDTNSGNAVALGTWYDHLTISNSSLGITLLDTTVYHDPSVQGPLTNGTAINRSVNFTLPSGANGGGNLQVTVTADYYNNIFEYNSAGSGESNNVSTVTVFSGIAAYPDLQVVNLGVQPVLLNSGTNLTVQWQDTNSGNALTPGSWYDHLTISNSSLGITLLDTTVYYDASVQGPLTNGTARSRSANFTLPSGANGAGTLVVTVTADYYNNIFEYNPDGTAESNNSATTEAVSGIAAYPDLQIAGLTVQPSALASGTSLTVYWLDTNSGNADAMGSWYDQITIRNATLGETLLGTTVYFDTNVFGPLTNGTAVARAYNFTLPTTSDGAGSLVVTVTADYYNNIFEYNPEGTAENNNSASLTETSAVTPLPDLVVSSLTSSNNVLTSQLITAQLSLKNQGLAAANGDTVQQVYISSSPVEGSGVLSAEADFNGVLGVGQSVNEGVTLLTPSVPGTYWLIAQADANNNISELVENNNYLVSPTPLVVNAAYTATIVADIHSALANTPIPMHGQAFIGNTTTPAASVPVTIHIQVRGTDRTVTVLTAADGTFTNLFQPLPNEAGVYQISAALPSVANPPAQDSFVLIGMSVAAVGLVDLTEGTSVTNSTALNNLSDTPLTGLTVTVTTNQANLAVSATVSTNVLDGFAAATLNFTITALNPSIYQSPVILHLSSAEGATADLTIMVRVEALRPTLVLNPTSLSKAMVRGVQTPVAFTILNQGGAATGPLQIVTPSVPWLSLASTNWLPPLAPGSNAVVTLLLTPASDLPFGDYNGTIVLQSTNVATQIAYTFRAVSDATGNMEVIADDEYTYFTAGSPHVTNAAVVVSDALTGLIVATNLTDATGTATFSNLTEAYYIVDVSADGHAPFRESALVPAGATTNIDAFLTRQTVSYDFTVTPTTVADTYTFVINSTFETQVPIPVVTIDPASLDLAQYPGQQFQVLYTISNHGLIDAESVVLQFPSASWVQITALVTNLGKLKANSSYTVPVLFTRITTPPPAAGKASPKDFNSGTCSVTANMLWNYLCGPNVVDKSTASYVFDSTGCNLVDLYSQVYHLVPDAGGGGGGGAGGGITSQDYFDYLNSLNPVTDFGPPPGYHFACNSTAPAAVSAKVQPRGGTSVCAKVDIRLDQKGVLTRDAFNATLEINNDLPSALTNVQASIQITDVNGNVVSTNFGISTPKLSGLSGIDGTGNLPGSTAGSATWTIIPTLDAAPDTGMTVYLVGGTLSYTQNGTVVTVPLAPAPIQVFPQPELQVRYFHDRNVYADDPFTPQIEPSIPYSLAVQVNNVGYGAAQSLSISGGNPQIVDNVKGLLINFNIIGTQVENQQETPALTVNLGSIDPGTNKIARWLFTSSIQGSFTNFSASFSEVDQLGNPRLSLIRSVEIHELTHIVDAGGTFEDFRPDFLVNDMPDTNFLPDTLYLSDGSVVPVSAVTDATLTGALSGSNFSVTVTAALPAGWSYLQFGDPGPGQQYQLMHVLRPDNSEIPMGTNVWTTDRNFIGGATVPVHTNLVHLLDYNSGGTYTLVYAPIVTNSVDTTPPTSQVAVLPAASQPTFTVQWSGTDNPGGSGIGFFDIYASTNGGPFAPWITNTKLQGAVFNGLANTTYAFFSRATDLAGNQEAARFVADAQTTTSVPANTPPAIAPIPTQFITEGSLFSFTPSASDAQPTATLTWSLLPGGPAAVLIAPQTGHVTWQTGIGDGGTTNIFALEVADNGSPSLSATQVFYVVVSHLNHPPSIIALPVQVVVNEESQLMLQLSASDSDLPAQTLTWQLGANPPLGMHLDSVTGLLTWTPTQSQDNTTNLITVTVTDNGTPPLSDSQTIAVVVSPVNHAPVLAAIGKQTGVVLQTLVITNTATDSDLPAQTLTYNFAGSVPSGARITTNGIFSWTPSRAQARSTNTITVSVTDNGYPPLSDSNSFTVVVGDYLEVMLGSTILQSGQTGSLAVAVSTTTPVTNLNFTINVGGGGLTNFALANAAPPLGSATLTQTGSNQFQAILETLNGQTLTGTQTVSALNFGTRPATPSVFIPVAISNVAANQPNGSAVSPIFGDNGRVTLINSVPLVEAVSPGGHFELTVFAPPNSGYTVETASGLTAPLVWLPFLTTTSAGSLYQTFPVSTTNSSRFFRVKVP